MVDFRLSVCCFLLFMLLCFSGGVVAGIVKLIFIAVVYVAYIAIRQYLSSRKP